MPKESAWLVRASLVNLVLGFTLGALLLVHKAMPLRPELWALRPLHIELLLWGAMVQLAFGVALWILPRAPAPVAPRRTGWAVVALLNGSIWLFGLGSAVGAGTLVGAARLGEAAALAVLARRVWPRVRAFARAHPGG